jgi:hypothetical protein
MDSEAKVWSIGFYVCLVLLLVGLVLAATPILTTALDVEDQKVAFAQGQAGLKSVRAENVSFELSPFSYYVVTAAPHFLPTSVLPRTGQIKLYRYPDQLVYESSIFYYDTGTRSGSVSIVPSIPNSGTYIVEADVQGSYWRDSDWLNVEVVRMLRPALMMGLAFTFGAAVALAVTVTMLRKHGMTFYGLTIERS